MARQSLERVLIGDLRRMNTVRTIERLSLALYALRQSQDDIRVRSIDAAIHTVRTALEAGDDSAARGTLRKMAEKLRDLHGVAPVTVQGSDPIKSRSEPALLPGVATAIRHIGEALHFLGD
jgi:hypothetical protein